MVGVRQGWGFKEQTASWESRANELRAGKRIELNLATAESMEQAEATGAESGVVILKRDPVSFEKSV